MPDLTSLLEWFVFPELTMEHPKAQCVLLQGGASHKFLRGEVDSSWMALVSLYRDAGESFHVLCLLPERRAHKMAMGKPGSESSPDTGSLAS